MENIYEILIDNCTNERLDKIAFRDTELHSINNALDEALKQYDKLSLSKKETMQINKLLDLYVSQSSRYATLAYKQGIEDAVMLLKEIGII